MRLGSKQVFFLTAAVIVALCLPSLSFCSPLPHSARGASTPSDSAKVSAALWELAKLHEMATNALGGGALGRSQMKAKTDSCMKGYFRTSSTQAKFARFAPKQVPAGDGGKLQPIPLDSDRILPIHASNTTTDRDTGSPLVKGEGAFGVVLEPQSAVDVSTVILESTARSRPPGSS